MPHNWRLRHNERRPLFAGPRAELLRPPRRLHLLERWPILNPRPVPLRDTLNPGPFPLRDALNCGPFPLCWSCQHPPGRWAVKQHRISDQSLDRGTALRAASPMRRASRLSLERPSGSDVRSACFWLRATPPPLRRCQDCRCRHHESLKGIAAVIFAVLAVLAVSTIAALASGGEAMFRAIPFRRTSLAGFLVVRKDERCRLGALVGSTPCS
jgi:hypothetical protein